MLAAKANTKGITMRKLSMLLLALCAATAVAKDDNTSYNRYYVESEKDQPWQEQALAMPAYPDAEAQWADMYVSNTYTAQPKLMINSIRFGPDQTIHYILNIQSAQGFDNITAEAMHCATRSVKTFGYGDSVNRRWITPRVSDWKVIGSVMNVSDPVRAVLYKTFCEDGLPRNEKQLIERIRTRAMR